MKVLMISDMYPTTRHRASGTFVQCQAAELVRQGIDVQVLLPVAERFPFPKTDPPCEPPAPEDPLVFFVHYLHFPQRVLPSLEVFFLLRKLTAAARRVRATFRFDILHAHRLFPNGYVSMLLARRLGVPCVVTAHGNDVNKHPFEDERIARYTRTVIAGADQVVAVSQALREKLLTLAEPLRPVRVVYNGIDTERFRPRENKGTLRTELRLPETGIGICTVCRLVEEKGLAELAHAFTAIARSHPGVWLVMVGDGPLRTRLEIWVREEHLKGRVFLPGAVRHNDVSLWLAATDLFVLPSYREGIPLTVFEAMACARPVVATTVGGIPELALNGITAILIPPREAGALRSALLTLIESAEVRQRLGEAGCRRVGERFRWSQSAASLATIYGEVLAFRKQAA